MGIDVGTRHPVALVALPGLVALWGSKTGVYTGLEGGAGHAPHLESGEGDADEQKTRPDMVGLKVLPAKGAGVVGPQP